MTHIYNGNFMKQLLIDPVILSAVTLTQTFVMVQRTPLWPQSSGLNASPVKTLLSELPFLCLLTAARWRHKTSLSLRHIYFLTMRFSCKVVCHLICLNLLMSQQNVQPWVDKSALMPSHWSLQIQYIGAIQCSLKSFQNPSIEKWGNLCSKNKRNIKRKLKGAHMRALCRGPAKTPSPHRGLYSNRHLASCRHLRFIDCFLTPITPTVGRSHGNAPSIKEALLHPQWKSCELIYYDRSTLMNLGVM